jgi:hypothetical protein
VRVADLLRPSQVVNEISFLRIDLDDSSLHPFRHCIPDVQHIPHTPTVTTNGKKSNWTTAHHAHAQIFSESPPFPVLPFLLWLPCVSGVRTDARHRTLQPRPPDSHPRRQPAEGTLPTSQRRADANQMHRERKQTVAAECTRLLRCAALGLLLAAGIRAGEGREGARGAPGRGQTTAGMSSSTSPSRVASLSLSLSLRVTCCWLGWAGLCSSVLSARSARRRQ